MKANNYISKKEHKLLLIATFITLAFAVTSFVSFSIENYNKEVKIQQFDLEMIANYGATFAVDVGQDFRPLYRFWFVFLTFFIFLAVLNAKKFLTSISFTLIPFLIFIYWFAKTNYAISTNETLHGYSTLDRIFTIATTFDYIVFFLVSILLFWQISILLRMLIKTLQRKNELP